MIDGIFAEIYLVSVARAAATTGLQPGRDAATATCTSADIPLSSIFSRSVVLFFSSFVCRAVEGDAIDCGLTVENPDGSHVNSQEHPSTLTLNTDFQY